MWNPIEWSIRFGRASATKDHDRVRALRRDVWETTAAAVRAHGSCAGIPENWRAKLVHREEIVRFAEELYRLSKAS